MARRRETDDDLKKRLSPPPKGPCATAALNRHQIWVLDVHTRDARRVFVGTLAQMEARLDDFLGADDPDKRGANPWLFPIERRSEAWWSHLAAKGWFRGGLERPYQDYQPAGIDAALEAQVDQWRREAMGG